MALESGFAECFFSKYGFGLVDNRWHLLVQSRITWICFDIAWIVKGSETVVRDITQELLGHFKRWCQKSWPGVKLQRNFSGCNGYYNHSVLLLLRSKQRGKHASKLENIFYTFLRDLNLSYTGSQYVEVNTDALGDAFRRFGASFENILEEIREETISREQHDLCNRTNSLNLNR